MHKKLEVNRTKINGGCQSYTKAAPRESWSNFTLTQWFFWERFLDKLRDKNEKKKIDDRFPAGILTIFNNFFLFYFSMNFIFFFSHTLGKTKSLV